MTFGKIKSVIENNLLESYRNESEFKKTIKEFKQNVLNNKSISKVYMIYDQLSSPQGLNESEAKEFLEEGISLINRILPNVKIPKALHENTNNKYGEIDTLVYLKNIDIKERIVAKKKILETIMKPVSQDKQSINIPISSMVKIANQTLSNYLETLDESARKELIQIISEDTQVLEKKFEELKVNTLLKLESVLKNETNDQIKSTVTETIERVKVEKFDQISYLRLKNLESSL